jgi:DnaK suppressor protein
MATIKRTQKTAKKKTAASSHTKKKAVSSRTVKAAAPSSPSREKAAAKKSPRAESDEKKNVPASPRLRKIQEIRVILLQQKDSLLSEAEVALNELPGQTLFPDMGDQASAETDMNFMLRLRGREQRLLKKIDEALERIENESFGICDDCGNEIDLKRLMARPVTTMCIECKTIQEEEEKRREV